MPCLTRHLLFPRGAGNPRPHNSHW